MPSFKALHVRAGATIGSSAISVRDSFVGSRYSIILFLEGIVCIMKTLIEMSNTARLPSIESGNRVQNFRK